MTGSQIESLVLDELRRASLRLRYEIRRSPTGLHVVLWSDLCWMEGIGGRRVFGRDDALHNREVVVAILVLHSRVPSIVFGGGVGGLTPLQTLHLPPRCPEPVLRVLVAHALAQTLPTPRRLREARRRLRAAGVRLSDFRQERWDAPARHR